jgi:Protein of unknown function (DUF2950)
MRLINKDNANSSFKMRFTTLLLAGICSAGYSHQAVARTDISVQATFDTPTEAGQALQMASLAYDENGLGKILGAGSKDILSSGDPLEDKAAISSFVAKYNRMNRWVTLTDGSSILYIGADNYPFPIPLVRDSSGKWYFDTEAGEDEMLARRIGRNELLAIDAISAIANAQEIYFKTSATQYAAQQYAQRIISTPGKKDGLYWDASAGQPPSPLGSLPDFVESITAGDPQVIDGYSFRILTAQGDAAKGANKNYLSDGRMIGGFAIIASPAKYADSGIMTFILNRDGVVYQKDLGENTAAVAASIETFNPTDGWTPAE